MSTLPFSSLHPSPVCLHQPCPALLCCCAAAGRVIGYLPPGGPHVRMDSHLYPDYLVPPNYDSLLGKLIVWGDDREAAINRMKRALGVSHAGAGNVTRCSSSTLKHSYTLPESCFVLLGGGVRAFGGRRVQGGNFLVLEGVWGAYCSHVLLHSSS